LQLQGQALLKKRLLEQADDPVPLVNQVLQKYCFGQPNPTLTREMLADAKKYANREMSETDYWDLKEKYDEKTLLNLFFEGSVHLQQMTEQAFGDVRMENRMIKTGLHPLLVSEEEAKIFHSAEYGTHSPDISTRFQRLGTPHGMERCQTGLMFDLYKAGVIEELTAEGLIAYAFESQKRIVRADAAVKMVKEINKQRRERVASLVDGRVGEDKMTKKVLEVISRKGMEENWSFEKVNNLGRQGRKLVKQVEDDLGKELGHLVIKQEILNKEELAANHMEHVCKTMGIAFDDFFAVAWHKIMGRKKNKKA